jgi:hypothetical protein
MDAHSGSSRIVSPHGSFTHGRLGVDVVSIIIPWGMGRKGKRGGWTLIGPSSSPLGLALLGQ